MTHWAPNGTQAGQRTDDSLPRHVLPASKANSNPGSRDTSSETLITCHTMTTEDPLARLDSEPRMTVDQQATRTVPVHHPNAPAYASTGRTTRSGETSNSGTETEPLLASPPLSYTQRKYQAVTPRRARAELGRGRPSLSAREEPRPVLAHANPQSEKLHSTLTKVTL